jgi:hypothetical protein
MPTTCTTRAGSRSDAVAEAMVTPTVFEVARGTAHPGGVMLSRRTGRSLCENAHKINRPRHKR